MIEYLLPGQGDEPLETLLARIASTRNGIPFNEKATKFVAALSQTLLTDRAFREYPELMAMAHWFRLANLRDLQQNFLPRTDVIESVFLPRGVVFHIAPANVDSVFVYSWLLSLLCGNANIARVSRQRSVQMQKFFSMVTDLLQRNEYMVLANTNLVVSYDHDAVLTEQFSACCDMRVIWGGDSTIRQIRSIPLPPLANELVFADRFSLAVINAGAVMELNAGPLTDLTRRFYNDTFWFNQQACSSPRALIWIGDAKTCKHAQDKFWSAMAGQICRSKPENLPAQVMDRTTTLYRIAHQHPGACVKSPPAALPARILVDELNDEDRNCHDGNGLFVEIERPRLDNVIGLLSSRDQTIACFGFDRTDWLELLAGLPPHAADRIVPIGEALSFNPIWDGVNLLRSFTREVSIKDK